MLKAPTCPHCGASLGWGDERNHKLDLHLSLWHQLDVTLFLTFHIYVMHTKEFIKLLLGHTIS